ncbi:MAG TPA: DUF2809 domain-containing protein [Deltaproteobacteria bacterium]|nr:DUF2809 domain-containing protein [Deltaproteobacteria bacterium]
MEPRAWLRPRIVPLLAALLTAGAGLGARAVLTGAVANVGGVALWSVLVACLILAVRPSLPGGQLFALTLGISVAVELFQLTGVPLALYRIHRLSALVLGTSFQWADLPAYLLGSLAAGLGQGLSLRARRAADPGRGAGRG